jgi:ATP-dependent 26S proteasome regulatory subunit
MVSITWARQRLSWLQTDRIEIPLPNEVGRLEIMKIHAAGVVTEGDIDFESVVKMSDGLNGADLRNVVTEAYVYCPQLITSDTNSR